ncbi:unnamed protein product [Trichobilharzia regenti]|nr:unnamed protein product [Trichobilharzia regenti]
MVNINFAISHNSTIDNNNNNNNNNNGLINNTDEKVMRSVTTRIMKNSMIKQTSVQDNKMVNINFAISHNSTIDNNNNDNNNGLINNTDEKVMRSVTTRIMKNSLIKQLNVQVEVIDKG